MVGAMRTAGLLGALVGLSAARAGAEGEHGPMFGGAVIAAHYRGPGGDVAGDTEVAGLQGELAFWHGPLGVAIEGSRQWTADADGPRVGAVAASLRALVYRQLVPALLEPRDVELGIELQGIAERSWWKNLARERDPVSYGVGLAIRLRGDTEHVAYLLAESRLFVRVLASRPAREDAIARGGMLGSPDRELAVTIGLGAAFGGGEPAYLERFRPHPEEPEIPIRIH
jgi:hypothetical protein